MGKAFSWFVSLENDLIALRLCHDRIIDTAILHPHPNGLPTKHSLRALSKLKLGIFIQDGSHDSLVDAKSSLDLVKLYIKQVN